MSQKNIVVIGRVILGTAVTNLLIGLGHTVTNYGVEPDPNSTRASMAWLRSGIIHLLHLGYFETTKGNISPSKREQEFHIANKLIQGFSMFNENLAANPRPDFDSDESHSIICPQSLIQAKT